jgi:hypothetical protein
MQEQAIRDALSLSAAAAVSGVEATMDRLAELRVLPRTDSIGSSIGSSLSRALSRDWSVASNLSSCVGAEYRFIFWTVENVLANLL